MEISKAFKSMDFLVDFKKLGVPASYLENFEQSFDEGPKNIKFTDIVSWLSNELQALCDLECCVTPITDPDDFTSFVVEVSSFMKETMCPYCCLMEGSMSQRLIPRENKIKLFRFMITELYAAQMVCSEKSPAQKTMILKMQESPTAKILKEMLISLKFSKPPANITPVQLFTKVEGKIKDLLNIYPMLKIEEPLFAGTLTNKQWFALEKLQAQMFEEFKGRRNMLLMRLDVTIKSFSWSDRLKNSDGKIAQIYDERRKQLAVEPAVCLADLLAARKDLVFVEKTSSASVRKNTKSSINKVVIGSVPDRGGRPEEQQPPPPEVPSWQKSEPPKSNFGGSSSGHGEKRTFSNYNDRNSTSGFNNKQSNGTPQSNNSYGYQGKNFNYSTPRNEPVLQQYVYQDGLRNTPKDYGYMPHGGGNFQAGNFQGGNFQGGSDFSSGFGGYSATGGNFQQYCGGPVQCVDPQQAYRNPRGGYGRGGRGGGGRGGRGGRGGADYYQHRQY